MRLGMVGIFLSAALAPARAQNKPEPATVSAVLLSDLHLDPFHDPAKVPQLVKTPIDEWQAILSAPDSATQEADFAAVQKACKAKQNFDSPYRLLRSALDAAAKQTPDARFVTVSGDLLVHDFDCRYRAALKLPPAAGDDQSLSASFAAKTTNFVINQVDQAFPHIPVYMALGNNDSRCNHNRLDVHDAYLKATGEAVVEGLVGISTAERKRALETYHAAGYYAVTMAAPMQHTRLLVIDDIYMMAKYSTCEADDKDRKGAAEQIAWLNKELDAAKARGEQVWVLGHLPPSVNPKSAAGKLCTGGEAEPYLSTPELADALTRNAGLVRLGIFGHTHMDELHLVGTKEAGVPIKIVASVTPVSGNQPSFTVGKVAPGTSTLEDYSVYMASNGAGTETAWSLEYSFDQAYGEPAFTPSSLGELIARFRADPASATPPSQAYESHFFKGSALASLALAAYWPGYVCSLDNSTPESFKACACASK
jgi:sphingomyelin phosphodiesterase acid-like 3